MGTMTDLELEMGDFFSATATDAEGNTSEFSDRFPVEEVTGFENDLKVVKAFETYPNPFNNSLNIKYFLEVQGATEMTIHNVQGQMINQLVNQFQLPGQYSVTWDGRSEQGGMANNGMYIILLKVDGILSRTEKIIINR